MLYQGEVWRAPIACRLEVSIILRQVGGTIQSLFRRIRWVQWGAYRFCPTPDCPSVYKVCPRDGEPGRPFVCGACGVETCTKCHMEFHPSVSCERYREFKVNPDLSLEEWREGKDFVKDCPSCGHTIEKAEGCNHVECLCGKHLCWVCLESFDCSDSCYDHLRSVHHAIM
uniref:RBR-type E3 ubiquitin transferase n=1 Tax=Ananas comosus var. bracteatus TaxID=296719 RepID=A0A6V7P643_ANACO|nr:unnamed protein product [Ananas comosus var. bracteatus]